MEKSIQPLNQGITVRTLLGRMRDRQLKATLLGVGPVSELTVRATIELARDHDFPPIFIASRNQVDSAEFGGGYLMGGMDQCGFVQLIRDYSRTVGYTGPLYVCRDHGGPWQRNKELDERYPVEPAMRIARESLSADLRSGFNYIHVDPTKCPHEFSLDDLCRWTVELVGFCEELRREIDQGPVDYEIGAEDIRGGETSAELFKEFLRLVIRELETRGLPGPTCIVGQTGTLTRGDCNVGRFNRDACRQLVETASRYGVGFKEHNGDYLSAASCRIHPELGISGMNVAPEFGLVETDSLLCLSELEQKLVREGWLADEEASGFAVILRDLTFERAPWRKWMTEEFRNTPRERIENDEALRTLISRVCGHYLYHEPQVQAARLRLVENVDRYHLLPEPAADYVKKKVKQAISFYVEHLRLDGINSALSAVAPKNKRTR